MSVKVWINSVDVTPYVDKASVQWTESLYHRIDNATFRIRGVYPVEAQRVQIENSSTPATRYFNGTIQRRQQRQVHRQQQVWHPVDCVDNSRLLGRRLVTETFTSWRVDSIAHRLVNSYSSGFTTTGIQAINSVLGRIEFTFVPLPKALTRLAQRIGVQWKLSATDDVEFGDLSGGSQPVLEDSATHFWGLEYGRDDSQIRNRVFVEGNGAAVATAVNSGDTTIPLDDGTYFSTSGGMAKVLTSVVSYGALKANSPAGSNMGWVQPPPVGLYLNGNDLGSLDSNAVYRYVTTIITSEGQTTPSAELVCSVSGVENQLVLNFGPAYEFFLLEPKGAQFIIYRSAGDGSTLYWRNTHVRGTSTFAYEYVDQLADSGLAVGSIANSLTLNTAGYSGKITSPGVNSIAVDDLSVFPDAPGWIRAADQVIRYGAKSAASGVGVLSSIPSAGAGAIIAPVRAATITTVPFLNSVVGLAQDLSAGDPIHLLERRDNTSAQSLLAALEGGNGVHEYPIQDWRLNAASAQERGDAELLLFALPEDAGSYKTRNESVVTGQFAIINLTSPTAIESVAAMQQQITYRDFHDRLGPIREVEFSTHYRDFFDVVGELEDPGS